MCILMECYAYLCLFNINLIDLCNTDIFLHRRRIDTTHAKQRRSVDTIPAE